jgi:hypothetical protein
MKYKDSIVISKVSDSDANFEKAEMDLLRNALNHTYTERFKMMTTLMKMDNMFRKAKITHQKDDSQTL